MVGGGGSADEGDLVLLGDDLAVESENGLGVVSFLRGLVRANVKCDGFCTTSESLPCLFGEAASFGEDNLVVLFGEDN